MENIEIHVVDHCNINCRSCDNFSPIAPKWFITVESFTEQLTQLARLGKVGEIRLMGGEPLLHPSIIQLMATTRIIFPNSKISLLTNGTLFKKMTIRFWETLRDMNISMWLSIYEPDFDIEHANKMFDKYGLKDRVQLCHAQTLHNPKAALFHNLSLDLSGNGNALQNWQRCYLGKGRCTTLREGKIYPCECASLIDIFNKHFGESLEPADAMDIYTNSMEEIGEYLKHPISFCKYCNTAKRESRYYPHEKSKGEIGEWI